MCVWWHIRCIQNEMNAIYISVKRKYPLFTSLYTFAYKQQSYSNKYEIYIRFQFYTSSLCLRILHFAMPHRQTQNAYLCNLRHSTYTYIVQPHINENLVTLCLRVLCKCSLAIKSRSNLPGNTIVPTETILSKWKCSQQKHNKMCVCVCVS